MAIHSLTPLALSEPLTRRNEKYSVVFKRDKARDGRYTIPMGRTFGWGETAEAVLTRVEEKLRTDPLWAAKFWDAFGVGRFMAVRLDAYVELPDMSAVLQRIETV